MAPSCRCTACSHPRAALLCLRLARSVYRDHWVAAVGIDETNLALAVAVAELVEVLLLLVPIEAHARAHARARTQRALYVYRASYDRVQTWSWRQVWASLWDRAPSASFLAAQSRSKARRLTSRIQTRYCSILLSLKSAPLPRVKFGQFCVDSLDQSSSVISNLGVAIALDAVQFNHELRQGFLESVQGSILTVECEFGRSRGVLSRLPFQGCTRRRR